MLATMVRVGVVGAGYVGLTTAVCLTSIGHDVLCAENDPARLDRLSRGEVPFHEPGLDTLLAGALGSGRLRFVARADEAAGDRDVVILAVATPQGADGSHDLSDLDTAAREIRAALPAGAVVVTKSTVPVGTAERLTAIIGRADIDVASNPEFLSEGTAVSDFMQPARIIVGCTNRDAAWRVASLYGHISAPVVVTDPATAELIKLTANSFLATKLSFMNTVAAICEEIGGNVTDLAGALGLDPRIGSRYLQVGPGWGGSCLPKDTSALVHAAQRVGVDFGIVAAAITANEAQLARTTAKIVEAAGAGEPAARVAVWGLAFKAATDDLRDSPSVEIIRRLLGAGLGVTAYDPTVTTTRPPLPGGVHLARSAIDAARGAHCLAVLTEWDEFRWAVPADVGAVMAARQVVDGRNLLNAADWSAQGFRVRSVGS